MTNANDSYEKELNQIRERQQAVIDEIERVREANGGIVPTEIETIRADSLRILDEIDELRKQAAGLN